MPTEGNGKSTHELVKEYYGKQLNDKRDLKTSACCSTDSIPGRYQDILDEIEPEILEKFYGCSTSIPVALEGKTVLDLGCGTGRDVYLVSKLIGPDGFAIGVDMTDMQLSIAKKYRDEQMERFRFNEPNVDFRKGYIEDLTSAGIEDNSIDVVISNCVINLSSDKKAVFKEIFRVLKLGGELYFSDIFSGRRVPQAMQEDPVLLGECLSGALYIEDFRRILREIGCPDHRVYAQRQVILDNPKIEAKIGMVDFYSMTVRAFKLDSLEDICEDYGQVAIYKGNLPESPHRFVLDDHHIFITGKPMLVCGNTAAMLQDTRFSKYFEIMGDRSTHYGPFDCKPSVTLLENQEADGGGSCC